jgi:uncharacterized repeat protein (TIGR03803 family)
MRSVLGDPTTMDKTISMTRNAVRLAILAVAVLAGFCGVVHAQTETVIYTFGNTPNDGYEPAAPLLIDASGNLFGTTSSGGTAVLCPDPTGPNPCGTVFELVNSSGHYTEKVLYNFTGPEGDGDEPVAGLIVDSAGNFYGTTGYGGSNFCGASTCGTVFELVKSPTGYTEKVLYNFTGFDGGNPFAGLIMDSSGNLYGTADGGGANGYGVVFELVNSSGSYTEKVLYSFGASSADGAFPVAGLAMDSAGNLFGTTEADLGAFTCGLSSCGTVFELVKCPIGYMEVVLHTFSESDGANPAAGLIMDSSGNLYGTTSAGGAQGEGTVFELTKSSGTYSETVLYSFGETASDGVMPVASLIMDRDGNLFGTTKMGGSTTACGGFGCGTVFELVNTAGNYTEKLLHSFGGVGDGESPAASLVMDSSGKLYSTTEGGGSPLEVGTVFEIDPSATTPAVTLSSSALTFKQAVDITSSPQSATITNSGLANLVFGPTTVSAMGLEAPEFTIVTDTCSGATIAPSATCSVSVAFTPTLVATTTAGLTFSDNAVQSSQTVALTGIGLNPNPTPSFSPANLTFSPQGVSTTSPAQTVMLTNSGASLLAISAIATSPGFIETNNCGSGVAAGGSCAIQVTFAPTTTGQINGTLSVSDNAAGSPQTVELSGVGQNFTISVVPGTAKSVSVSAGATGTYSLSVSPQGGFSQTVVLSCAGAPSLAVCSVSPGMVTLDGLDPASSTVSISTTAASSAIPVVLRDRNVPPVILFTIVCELFALLLIQRRDHFGPGGTARIAVSCALLITAAVCISSCGGGAGGTGSGSPGTPPGTYTLTVTGTSGALSNSTTVTLSIN